MWPSTEERNVQKGLLVAALATNSVLGASLTDTIGPAGQIHQTVQKEIIRNVPARKTQLSQLILKQNVEVIQLAGHRSHSSHRSHASHSSHRSSAGTTTYPPYNPPSTPTKPPVTTPTAPSTTSTRQPTSTSNTPPTAATPKTIPDPKPTIYKTIGNPSETLPKDFGISLASGEQFKGTVECATDTSYKVTIHDASLVIPKSDVLYFTQLLPAEKNFIPKVAPSGKPVVNTLVTTYTQTGSIFQGKLIDKDGTLWLSNSYGQIPIQPASIIMSIGNLTESKNTYGNELNNFTIPELGKVYGKYTTVSNVQVIATPYGSLAVPTSIKCDIQKSEKDTILPTSCDSQALPSMVFTKRRYELSLRTGENIRGEFLGTESKESHMIITPKEHVFFYVKTAYGNLTLTINNILSIKDVREVK